jgi:hypothetical protein
MPRARSTFEITLGGLAYLVAGIGALITLWASGHATVSLSPAAGGIVLMGVGLGVLGCRRLTYGAVNATPARFWSGVLTIPVLLVVTAILGASGVALNLRWSASESAFQREVSSLERGATAQSSVKIGSYVIDRIDVVGSGYLFDDAHGGDLTDCGAGFAFLPDGPSAIADDQDDTFAQLDGDWYTWKCFS